MNAKGKAVLVMAAVVLASFCGGAMGSESMVKSGENFEYMNSSMDVLRGRISYSVKNRKSTEYPYTAYLLIQWGNLDRVKPVPRGYYENWDGYLQMGQGRAKVEKKIFFDDGWQKYPDLQGPHPGSGWDQLLDTGNPARVEWLAGVVGATDGLLIRIDLPFDNATGEIKAGNFVFPFAIVPKAGNTK